MLGGVVATGSPPYRQLPVILGMGSKASPTDTAFGATHIATHRAPDIPDITTILNKHQT